MAHSDLIRLACLLLTIQFACMSARADDWPQWRGVNRDGIWSESGIVDAVPVDGLKVSWRAKIGRGYSGPVVAGGRVYVTDQVLNPEAERVVCFDEVSGEQLWVHSYPTDYEKMEYGNGPRASPTVSDGRVYTLGTQGDLCCLDAATGKLLWEKDLENEYEADIPQYGASVAPLVEGDVVIVSAGGKPEACVIAFDHISGKERWRALDDEAGYSAPIVVERGGVRQTIVWTAKNIVSFNAATGKEYWREKWIAGFDAAQVLATPVLHKDRLLFMMGWNRGSKMFRLDSDKPAATLLWRTRSKPATTMSTPVMLDDKHFFSVDGTGALCCNTVDSGKEVWRTTEVAGSNPNAIAHLTANEDDRFFIFNHRGHLISASVTGEEYRETGRTLLVEPTAAYRAQGPLVWSHPAYANRHVVARNDRVLVRASLDANDYPKSSKTDGDVRRPQHVLSDFDGRSAALAMDFSPNGETLALGTWSGVVRLIDTSSNEPRPIPLLKFRNKCVGVAFSADGSLMAYVGGSEFAQGGDPKRTAKVMLWDVNAKKLRGDLLGHKTLVTCAAFSPDGKVLVTGSADNTIRLWNTTDGQPLGVLSGAKDAVWTVQFVDNKTLVSGDWDGMLRFWDVKSQKQLDSVNAHDTEILSIAVSPDGTTIATGSGDWTIRLWNSETRDRLATLEGHHGSVYSVAFAPDGAALATGSGDETTKLWDVRDPTQPQELTTLRGHRSGISAVAFSPDGRTLASAGRDDAVRIWNVPSQ